ncbi:MAG TPA: hypothetical protein VFN31_01180 [Candidatus Saccharimonadales bacterium]|nr:hypothetical protein [Candidatus Saccharimonadales bacterium]
MNEINPVEILSQPNPDPIKAALAAQRIVSLSEQHSFAGGVGFIMDSEPLETITPDNEVRAD